MDDGQTMQYYNQCIEVQCVLLGLKTWGPICQEWRDERSHFRFRQRGYSSIQALCGSVYTKRWHALKLTLKRWFPKGLGLLVTVSRNIWPLLFHDSNPSGLLSYMIIYFRILFRFAEIIPVCKYLRVVIGKAESDFAVSLTPRNQALRSPNTAK